MADRRQLEFFLLRYVPDAVKDEFVNLGVVMIEPSANGSGFADVRFTRDWRRVRCLDPDADVEMLEALGHDVQRQLRETHSRELLLKKLQDQFSNIVQVSPMKACLSTEPAKELETLAHLYVESRPQRRAYEQVTWRRKILEKMEDAFESAGISDFVARSVRAAEYTQPGDPQVFDFAYSVGNSLKIFQVVSLKANVSQALVLAARYPSIAGKIREKAHLNSRLTAVIDGKPDWLGQEAHFALRMMQDAKIDLKLEAQIPAIAETARQELRA